MSNLIQHDPAVIDKLLVGQTIESIMYGHRNEFKDDKMMCLSLYLSNGQAVHLWSVPSNFDGLTTDEFFRQNKAPRPYLAISIDGPDDEGTVTPKPIRT